MPSGLVWWSPGGARTRTDRFVSALRTSGATRTPGGRGDPRHGPDEVIDSCQAHLVPLLAVPASFRAITEAVHLRQWGDLGRRPAPHYALPENVRAELSRLLDRGADPGELLDRASPTPSITRVPVPSRSIRSRPASAHRRTVSELTPSSPAA